ncbi:glycosyltransferase family 9 protein [Ferrovibrio xuzhouensis]|uniref:Glycosyltransferase family 9 protein n=1 Tax=Ferrovibrio xuzhouensis TaxID=1576914 RepID=A0ABV7VEU1_9PROT
MPDARLHLPPATTAPVTESILVIRHGGLRGIVQALGPLKAIRSYHPRARITLLTTAPYADFLRASGYADMVCSDPLPLFRPSGWRILLRRLHGEDFDRVYDLQCSLRSSLYFGLMPLPRPEWSGTAWGCSRPYVNPGRGPQHPVERMAEQLRQSGIPVSGPAELDWADADIRSFALPRRYVLLLPGGRRHKGANAFWPPDHYAKLARALVADGIAPVLIGDDGDAPAIGKIAAAAPGSIDLAGRTTPFDLVAMARACLLAVGNDTGALHLLAAAGAPTLALFSAVADPALAAPRGDLVRILRAAALRVVPVEEVLAVLAQMERPA